MSCPAITNKGGKLSISRFPVACELTLPELALLDYAVVPGVGSIGDTGIEQEISSYSTVNAGMSPQSKAAAVGKAWDVEMIESQSAARDVFETASAVANKDTYATRIEWPDGAVEFSIVQVSSPTYVKGAPSGVRIVRYTMIPSFIPIVTSSLPVASNVAIGGIPFIGATLTATYSYYSPLGLPESGTDYQWYADGVAIPGETSTTLLITGDYLGSFITFGVTPSDGLSYGREVMSAPVGPIADSARFTADSGLYTDTALTVPVTSYGDAVAGWDGGALVGVQPTLTARPAYGRMPVSGVVNQLTYTEDFSNAAWNKAGSAVSQSAGGWWELKELANNTAHALQMLSITTAGVNRYEVDVMADGRDYAILSSSVAGTLGVNLQTGAVVETTGSPSNVTVTVLDGGGYRIGFTHTAASGENFNIYCSQDGVVANRSYTGNSALGIKVRFPSLSVGADSVPYQRVNAAYDVTQSGVPGTPILYYDLGDDVLPAAMELPAVTGGTLVIAGEKGIWVDDSFNHAGGSWSLGPTTYTGGPSGLLPDLIGNRVLGFAVFAVQLTPEQLQVEVAYWMSRGAPGVWEGTELVSNPGGPFVDTIGWTGINNGALSVVGGNLTLTYGSNPGASASHALLDTFAAGELALIEVAHTARTVPNNCQVRLGSGYIQSVAAPPSVAYAVHRVVAGATSLAIGFGSGAPGDTSRWGMASVHKLTLNTDPYP